MCKKLIHLVCLIVVLGLAGSTSAALVAHWKFDNDLTDSVGTLTWTTNGGAGFSTDAKEGSHSLSVDGVDDYLSVTPTGPLLDAFSTKTVALWFKVNTTSGTQVLYDEGGTTRGLCIRINNGTLETAVREASTQATASTSFTMTTWTHAAATFDNGTLKLYVHGAEQASALAGFTMPTAHSNAAGIGARNGQDSFGGTATGDYFGGLIDDVRIYDNALSAEEIAEFVGGYPKAYNPVPADGSIHENMWVTLTWTPGTFAVSHDAYLGENFEDVNSGTGDTFRGNLPTPNLIAGFAGFPYPEGLVPGTTYYWRIDEVNDTEPNSPWKGDIWSFTVPPRTAYSPAPSDGIKYVDPNVALGWTAGLNAKLHYVYFGGSFDDVNDATTGTAQTGTTYSLGTLELEKTYYWRVDEFDGAATHKGDVWSFETIPVVAVTDPNLVVLWTLNEGMGTTAVDWSGHGHHGTITGAAQWVDGYMGAALSFADDVYVETAYPGVTGTAARTCCAWIKIPIAANRTIMSWGQNIAGQKWRVRVDATGGLRAENNGGNIYGVTNVADGRWHHVAVVFADDGSPDIADTLLYVDGQPEMTAAAAVTPNPLDTIAGPLRIGEDPWHNAPWLDVIDEARVYDKALTQEEIALVMRVDPLLAWAANPAEESTPDIEHVTPLAWTRGDKATQHEVYFGLDRDAVANADASDTAGIYRGRQSTTSYTPAEGLEWGAGPYFWRVDENNNDGTITKGRIWSFTVGDFLVVDDIESYNDLPEAEPGSNRIYLKWIDGFGTMTNGAFVGNLDVPLTERSNAHSGGQAMPLSYDNNFKFSEATLTLTGGNDWTRQGVTELSLWYRGVAANAGERMYVALNGTAVVYHNDPNAAQTTTWTEWAIPLQTFAGQGVNLANVTSITIGFGTRGNTTLPGGTGQMYFDDIRLYRPRITP